jgi:peptidoglycan/xylan/chitin deacetylase (PgdA/CDA1 family)
MYHKVSTEASDFLTVPVAALEQQFAHLRQQGYQTITCQELIAAMDGRQPLGKRSVLLTFDDGYVNNAELLYPLLQKYGLKATIFLTTRYFGQTNEWDEGTDALMDVGTLRTLAPEWVELALHSHGHQCYNKLSLAAIDEDLRACVDTMQQTGLPFAPAICYPFGCLPTDGATRQGLDQLLIAHGIRLGFRIGNRINRWPLVDRYAIQRIDIRGDEPFWVFKVKLKLGRVKPF